MTTHLYTNTETHGDRFYRLLGEALDKCGIPENEITVESCIWCHSENAPHSRSCPLGEHQKYVVANGGPYSILVASGMKPSQVEKMLDGFRFEQAFYKPQDMIGPMPKPMEFPF